MTLSEIKSEARKAAFARRKAARDPRRETAAQARLMAVLETHRGRPLSGYMPIRTELDPLPVMETMAETGPVGVPVIEGKGRPLTFRAWQPGCTMVPGPFGAAVPEAGALIEPEVLIVPLLAFDRRGYRLGYGGGFYDRTLERLRAARPTLAIGFAFAGQETAEVPLEPTDQRLDAIVTEAFTLEF